MNESETLEREIREYHLRNAMTPPPRGSAFVAKIGPFQVLSKQEAKREKMFRSIHEQLKCIVGETMEKWHIDDNSAS